MGTKQRVYQSLERASREAHELALQSRKGPTASVFTAEINGRTLFAIREGGSRATFDLLMSDGTRQPFRFLHTINVRDITPPVSKIARQQREQPVEIVV